MKELASRIRCHLGRKLVLMVSLPIPFCLVYFTLQHATLFTPTTFALSAIDRMITFAPEWVYVYDSLYFLMPIAPLLATREEELKRYTEGFVWLAAASFLIFLFYPVISPRPDGLTGVAAFDLLTSFEGKLNAFPSLHAGLCAYTLIFAFYTYRNEIAPVLGRALLVLGLGWSGAVLYATLATKQHYAVDLPAGIVLAWLSYHWSGYTTKSLRTNWFVPCGWDLGRASGNGRRQRCRQR